MNDAALIQRWTDDAAAPFSGWDFSPLAARMAEPEPPWSYPDLAKAAVAGAFDILDVATGGGEVFSRLAPFPGRATAVEGYEPNLPIARARLEPLGVRVLRGNTRSGMPFEDRTFDLVLNRHGGFRAAEMHRILQPGGVFLSQQVGGDNLADLAAAFDAPLAYPDNTLDRVCAAFRVLGCEIRRREAWRGAMTFADVGALAWFLKAIPWVVADFSVERHAEVLLRLHRDLQAGRPLRFTGSRFLVEVVRR